MPELCRTCSGNVQSFVARQKAGQVSLLRLPSCRNLSGCWGRVLADFLANISELMSVSGGDQLCFIRRPPRLGHSGCCASDYGGLLKFRAQLEQPNRSEP